jgi:hypothetical protein
LNPVPVLINKALIEIPPKFAGKPPVNLESKKKLGASGSYRTREPFLRADRAGTKMRLRFVFPIQMGIAPKASDASLRGL